MCDAIETDADMRRALTAIESESDCAHRKYQQLLALKRPILRLLSTVGDPDLDTVNVLATSANPVATGGTTSSSRSADPPPQTVVSLPATSTFRVHRRISILGVLYGDKCAASFNSLSASVQILLGLRQALTAYLERKKKLQSGGAVSVAGPADMLQSLNYCFGCANTFVGYALQWLQVSPCTCQSVTLSITSGGDRSIVTADRCTI